MADPDEEAFVAKDNIRFGTLEEAELARMDEDEDPEARKARLIASGNINVQDATEVMDLTAESGANREKQEKLLREIEMRRRVRAITVPVIDKEVRERLRSMGEPVTLFGEREMERRDRLRKLLATRDDVGGAGGAEEEEDEVVPIKELFYTEGPAALKDARHTIAEYSLRRASKRLLEAQARRDSPDEDEEAESMETLAGVARLQNDCSELGDERPISACAIAPGSRQLATVAWSGVAKVWNLENMQKEATILAHSDRITGVAWHPNYGAGVGPGGPCLVTGSADATARLWSLEEGGKLVSTLEGHTDRLARVAFHPSGGFLGTASYDGTWRLWDVETGANLLEQEGHSRAVYGLAFQCDGSLAASVGLDSHGRVWDLRTGRSIMVLQGHVKQVLGVDFAPNGYQLVTGSDDHTCRVWDLRKQQSLYTIPAHSHLISQVRVCQTSGSFFMSSSYDNTVKIWSMRDFKLVKTLAGHEGKVMGCDVADGGEIAASVAYDRTLKVWGQHAVADLDDVLGGAGEDGGGGAAEMDEDP